jgi:hypothetical protein
MKNKDYKRGYQDGVSACSQFLIDGNDLPSVVEDMKQYVLPDRNWRKRFYDMTGMRIGKRLLREK